MTNRATSISEYLMQLGDWERAKTELRTLRAGNGLKQEEFRRIAYRVALFYLFLQEDYNGR